MNNVQFDTKDESLETNNDDKTEAMMARRYTKRKPTEANYMKLEVPDDDAFLCKCSVVS